jgi:CHAT domain-containing protein
LDRIKALMQLVDVAGSAGDTFEAREKAEAAAASLEELGYTDPAKSDAETAINNWIRAATQSLEGVPLLGRLTQVGMWYDGILGARYAVLVRTNPAAADAVNKLQSSLQNLYLQANQEAQVAQAEHERELARYLPAPAAQREEKKGEDKKNGQGFTGYMQECRKIDEALAQIQNVCNERASTQAPMDDLLEQLHELQAQADRLNTPEYEAKTRLGEAYVLGHAGRAADIVPVAQEARTRLLAGRPARLSSFSESHQRYLYLDSLTREMQGRMMSGDLEAGFKIGESVIQDFESERYRVNNEFRQSALLGYVADFYTWTALAAFKLQNWDAMLATIDLIKARSAVRSRLVPDPPELFESKTAREFEELSDSGATSEEQKERRRQLWDLLSIARGQSSGLDQLPELTLPALQAALSSDEALIAYFWLNDTVLLSVAIDNSRFHAERIILKPDQAKLLTGFVTFIQGLKSSHNMDKQIAKIGDILLPPFLRDFLREKKRVIFSPHRGLHLFPFHAARWDGAFVGTEFAVSYVPNFSSILLPWNSRLDNCVLAIGIKEFANPAVRPLANVEDDVRAIQSYYEASGAKVEVMLGPQATRQRLEALRNSGELSKFRCVHLGTHGLSVFETPNQPLESSLLVQNGTLDAMDIANLRLNSELVVLSACHSGQRAIELRNLGAAPGDDIFGLQAALFKSGVRSILGTLWLVETESASAITREFHRNYAAGGSAEVALQESVKAYVADASALSGVYYWAPYFISSLGRQPKGENKAWQN